MASFAGLAEFVRVLGQTAFQHLQGYASPAEKKSPPLANARKPTAQVVFFFICPCICFHLLPCGTPHVCSTFCFLLVDFFKAKNKNHSQRMARLRVGMGAAARIFAKRQKYYRSRPIASARSGFAPLAILFRCLTAPKAKGLHPFNPVHSF